MGILKKKVGLELNWSEFTRHMKFLQKVSQYGHHLYRPRAGQ